MLRAPVGYIVSAGREAVGMDGSMWKWNLACGLGWSRGLADQNLGKLERRASAAQQAP